MSSRYALTYVNARGLIEPARMILSYGGAEWEDIRIPNQGPGTPIPQGIQRRCRFGQIPLLEFDNKRLVQSHAIIRYLARTFDLAGKDEFESAQCDEIGDAVKDLFGLFSPYFREPVTSHREKKLKEAAEHGRARLLTVFEDIIQENGGHLVGSGLTWADIVASYNIYQVQRVGKVELLPGFKGLSALTKNVFETPGIKEWIAKRPDTRF